MENRISALIVCFAVFAVFVLICLSTTTTLTGLDGAASLASLRSVFLHLDHSRYHPNASQPCTFAMLRNIYSTDHYFPGGGQWTTINGTYYYQPDVCKFRHKRVSQQFVAECLNKANISSVMTMGDSTGQLHSTALFKMVPNCSSIRHETLLSDGFIPDKTYFEHHLPEKVIEFLKVQFRFCSGCSSSLRQCNIGTRVVNLEHTAQTMILDNSMSVVFPTYHEAHNVMKDVWALTAQELVFRYYLGAHYPDVLLIFLPFVHAKHNTVLSRLPADLKYFKSIVDEYISNSTKVFYIPTYSEFVRGKSKNWVGRMFEGMTAAVKLDRMNHVLYDVMQNAFLDPESLRYGFFDMLDISKNRSEWSVDGVHMEHEYYDNAMTMFWETYCNSVALDQF